jgi:hypothetical protein
VWSKIHLYGHPLAQNLQISENPEISALKLSASRRLTPQQVSCDMVQMVFLLGYIWLLVEN